MQIYNCFCCIFVSLIIVGATEFIAAVHLLYNVLSFYTCQTGQFFEFNEIIYYIWRRGWDGANFRADSRVLPGERNHRGLFGACGALLPGEWSRGRAPSGSVPEHYWRKELHPSSQHTVAESDHFCHSSSFPFHFHFISTSVPSHFHFRSISIPFPFTSFKYRICITYLWLLINHLLVN